jgi:hypothetical protein
MEVFLSQQTGVVIVRSLDHSQQLFQARLAWNQAHPTKASPLLDSLCAGGWVESMVASDKSSTPSKSHLAFSNLLKPHFGPGELQDEACLFGGVWVDVFFPAHKYVFELDGPWHYLSNGDRDGRTLFKRRLLEGAGYRVHNIEITALHRMSLEEQTVYAAALATYVKGM